jgi:hypothetical protein
MTTQEMDTVQVQARRKEWLHRLDELAATVEGWANAKNWAWVREVKTISEPSLGTYDAPVVRVRSPQGEVRLEPVALDIVGGNGRVDLEAWPTLNRVKLTWRGSPPVMVIYTDSHVPLRLPWAQATFEQLVSDLLA